jgi:hypothetical protein
MTLYTVSNGNTIFAADIDQIVNAVNQMQGDAATVTVTGTTAGSATCYPFFQGGLKAFFLYFAGYRNSTATEQLLTLPVGFTTHAGWIAFGGIPQAHIYVGAVQQNNNIYVITGFPTPPGAGATTGNQNQFNGFQYGGINTAFDHIGLGVSQATTFSGGLLVIGI